VTPDEVVATVDEPLSSPLSRPSERAEIKNLVSHTA
jgi:hypothetical protein